MRKDALTLAVSHPLSANIVAGIVVWCGVVWCGVVWCDDWCGTGAVKQILLLSRVCVLSSL